MSERDLARHRSPERPATFLTDAGEAVTGRLAVVGRSGAVLAASTGMLATGGLVTPAHGVRPATATPVTSSGTALTSAFTTAPGLLRAAAVRPSGRATLRASMAATVDFESSAFTAAPALPRPVTPSRATPSRATRAAIGARAAAAATPVRPDTVPDRSAAGTGTDDASVTTTRRKALSSERRTAAPAERETPAAKHQAPTTKHQAPPTKHQAPPAKRKAPAAKARRPKSPAPQRPAPGSAARGSSVLAVAARYVGTPYRYGGTTPRGFDCSGFTGYVYRQLGISLPRTANQQMLATRHVTRRQARAGDLVFFVSGHHAYHVGIYAGGGQIYDSPRAGKSVSKRAIWDAAVVFGRVTR